jgi:hypothetical protein
MNTFRIMVTAIGVAILITLSAASAKADQFDKKTFVTFDQPVQVPGTVLPAGTYVFSRITDNPNVVRISSSDQTQVFATLLAIPDYRMEPAEGTVITFEERPNGSPKAIKSWFYPGDNTGEEFIYTSSIRTNISTNDALRRMQAEIAGLLEIQAKQAELIGALSTRAQEGLTEAQWAASMARRARQIAAAADRIAVEADRSAEEAQVKAQAALAQKDMAR